MHIYAYKHTHIYITIKMKEKEVINLRSKRACIGGRGHGKGQSRKVKGKVMESHLIKIY